MLTRNEIETEIRENQNNYKETLQRLCEFDEYDWTDQTLSLRITFIEVLTGHARRCRILKDVLEGPL